VTVVEDGSCPLSGPVLVGGDEALRVTTCTPTIKWIDRRGASSLDIKFVICEHVSCMPWRGEGYGELNIQAGVNTY